MSEVNVKYRSVLAKLTGMAEEKMEARDVDGVLKEIKTRHGREAEKIARAMLITLNEESILLQKRFKTVLSAGDTISFFPLGAGG